MKMDVIPPSSWITHVHEQLQMTNMEPKISTYDGTYSKGHTKRAQSRNDFQERERMETVTRVGAPPRA
jgi:hypothetical protein